MNQSLFSKKIEVRECLLSFSGEYFVFQFSSQNKKMKIHSAIILPLVLYRYENRLLTLREESRLRVFENRMLRRICGPKRDELMGVEKTT
jgi:hypothetical protein